MSITDIMAKLRKGEALDDAEKAEFVAFDLTKHIDGAQAAARKKAEEAAKAAADALEKANARLAEIEAEANAAKESKKSDAQKALERIAALEKEAADAKASAAKMQREQRLNRLVEKTGIKFVPGVDSALMRRLLTEKFSDMPDADLDAAIQAEKLDAHEAAAARARSFRESMKAAILDDSGSGSGNPPGGVSVGLGGKPVASMSAAERRDDLKKRGIL